MSNFFALLIGIDYYEPNPYYNSLQGAVRDIDKVAAYLEKSLQIPPERITRLTSPLPNKNSLADVRSARKEISPTYRNIVDAFNNLTETVNAGDLVYIHYSGHGGRAKTIFPDLKGEGQYDEGLVPIDVGNDGYYLRDVEIATLLKRMTDKGLIVTVIFDSCHSGGATRGDSEIRGARNGEKDTRDRPRDSAVATRDELVRNWLYLSENNPKKGWLPNQGDYVFLGACRPSEFAYESAFDGKDRNGALTYWTIDTLTSTTSALTYKSLYNRVKGMIQSKFPEQLPILIGEGDRLVFGDKRQYKPYTVVVVKVSEDEKEVTLDAGLAAGLTSGTRFAIYPSDDISDRSKQIAIVELTDNIQADKSTATILSASEGGIELKGKIEPGASAVMVAAPIDLIRKVRLFDRKQAGDKENELPADLVPKQTAALEKVRQALVGNGWLVEVKDGEEAHYQVAVGRDGAYEICMGMPVKNLRPALNIADSEAAKKVVDRSIHLAKYQSVQALDNPASQITELLQFELLDSNKKPFLDPTDIELKQGETVFLRLKNNFSQALNVAILDLEPTWEISQIPINGEEASFFQLDPDRQIPDIRLEFERPEGDSYEKAKETLKIFATKGVANFQWLTLPTLDKDIQSKSNLNAELEQKAAQIVTRGGAVTINPLNDLLSIIGADIDEPPVITRKAKVKPDPNADWTTKEIRITVI